MWERALSCGGPPATPPGRQAAWQRRWWRWCVSTQSACVLPGSDLTQPSLGAGSRPLAFARVHGVSPPSGSVLLAKFAGGKKHNVSAESSRCTRCVVLRARRGVGGDVRGPWQGRTHATISQGRRVGELEPELYSLAVGGWFYDLIKRTENRPRERRERSGGASARAQPVGKARLTRSRHDGLVSGRGRWRAKCT